jgi:hypothetical protein
LIGFTDKMLVKKIAPHYFEEEAERLLRYSLNDFDKDDLKYIKENIS